MTRTQKLNRMYEITLELREFLKDKSDLTAGQVRAMEYVIGLCEKWTVGDEYHEARINADLKVAADALTWMASDVPGECPHVPA